jgi:hypothetical protein
MIGKEFRPPAQITKKKQSGKIKHCALCGVGQTRSECSECQVPLCVYQVDLYHVLFYGTLEKKIESSQETVLQSRTDQKNDDGEKVQKQRQLLAKNLLEKGKGGSFEDK